MTSAPYGGKLINRVLCDRKRGAISEDLGKLQKIVVNRTAALDVEMIAVGAFSPLEGFMGSEDYSSVHSELRLSNGLSWTIPIMQD